MSVPADFPRLETLIDATVAVLKALGDSATNAEIHDAVVAHLDLPDRIIEFPHKSGTKTQLIYKLHWARTFLKRVGAADNTQRGVWTLTKTGREMSQAEIDGVVMAVRAQERKRKREQVEQADQDETDTDVEDAEETWSDVLLSHIRTIEPDAFERLCQRLLREAGFLTVKVTGRSSDGGIDGQGVLRVNLVSFQVIFQCKRWKGSVGSSVVRDFRGAMIGRADKGLIITTGTFTQEAQRESRRDGAPTIDLIDGQALCDLLKNHRLGVTVEMVEKVEVKPEFFATV